MSDQQTIERLQKALGRIAGKNDLSGVPNDLLESAARNALYECELIAREAIEGSPDIAEEFCASCGEVWVDGTPCNHGDGFDCKLTRENDRLRDGLQQLVDYVKDGCPDDGRYYVMTEAQAALKGISVCVSQESADV